MEGEVIWLTDYGELALVPAPTAQRRNITDHVADDQKEAKYWDRKLANADDLLNYRTQTRSESDPQ